MAGPIDPFDPTRPQLPDNAGELTATLRAIKEVLVDFRDRIVALEENVAKNVADEVGTIKVFGGSGETPPTGYVFCRGQELSRETFADLFAVIGATWGAGDGTTTFNAPDLRGRTVRGLDDGVGRDHEPGRIVGSYQEDTLQNVTGAVDINRRQNADPNSPLYNANGAFKIESGANSAAFMRSDTGVSAAMQQLVMDLSEADNVRTSEETVMKNAGANYIIKT